MICMIVVCRIGRNKRKVTFTYDMLDCLCAPCIDEQWCYTQFSAAGEGVTVLASVPEYRQSDTNKSWMCAKEGCTKKYPKPQLMFHHLESHPEYHRRRFHLYTTYQDPKYILNPLDDRSIVFKGSTEYVVGLGSKNKRKRSPPKQNASTKKQSKVNSLAAAAEAVLVASKAADPYEPDEQPDEQYQQQQLLEHQAHEEADQHLVLELPEDVDGPAFADEQAGAMTEEEQSAAVEPAGLDIIPDPAPAQGVNTTSLEGDHLVIAKANARIAARFEDACCSYRLGYSVCVFSSDHSS